MAVAIDATSSSESPSGETSRTWSHTISGSTRVLYVVCTLPNGGADITTASATYNSVSMAVTETQTATRQIRVFRLIAPATGSNNIVVSWTGTDEIRCIAASYTGVDQTTPEDTAVSIDGSAGGTSSTGDVTSVTGNMVMDVLVAHGGADPLNVGAGQTQIAQYTGTGGAGTSTIGASYESGATTTTMSWSWTGFVSYWGFAWDINADAGATPVDIATPVGAVSVAGAAPSLSVVDPNANDALIVIRQA